MAPMDVLMIASMASSLTKSLASSLINAITGKGVIRGEKGKEGGFLQLLAMSLMIKAMSGKGMKRSRRVYNNMDHVDKNFQFCSII